MGHPVALVTYVLIGGMGATVILAIGGLAGIVMVAVQARARRGPVAETQVGPCRQTLVPPVWGCRGPP